LEFRESLAKSLLGLDSGVKHSDFKSTCIPSFNENSKRLRCTFCYAHAKLNELPETHMALNLSDVIHDEIGLNLYRGSVLQ
jgi:hypothetical protein